MGKSQETQSDRKRQWKEQSQIKASYVIARNEDSLHKEMRKFKAWKAADLIHKLTLLGEYYYSQF